jgi:pyroglutamyl-peptidase
MLVEDGPVAYRSQLPLAVWAQKLRQAGIPAQVSYHAGTFLCNATLYLSHYLAEQQGLHTRSAFVHLPLDTSQVLSDRQDLPSLPAAMTGSALRLILDELA